MSKNFKITCVSLSVEPLKSRASVFVALIPHPIKYKRQYLTPFSDVSCMQLHIIALCLDGYSVYNVYEALNNHLSKIRFITNYVTGHNNFCIWDSLLSQHLVPPNVIQ